MAKWFKIAKYWGPLSNLWDSFIFKKLKFSKIQLQSLSPLKILNSNQCHDGIQPQELTELSQNVELAKN